MSQTFPRFAGVIGAIACGTALFVLIPTGASAQQPAAHPPAIAEQRDLPPSLLKQASVPEAAARRAALQRVPTGRITAVELERENGSLIYSYAFAIPGQAGMEEVNVSADDGRVVAATHESPAQEEAEQRSERHERTTEPEQEDSTGHRST